MNNDKIKELLEKSGFRYIKDDGIGWAGNYNSSLPKFAELIVKECIGIIENEAAQYAEPVWAVELVNDIKEHFGVDYE